MHFGGPGVATKPRSPGWVRKPSPILGNISPVIKIGTSYMYSTAEVTRTHDVWILKRPCYPLLWPMWQNQGKLQVKLEIFHVGEVWRGHVRLWSGALFNTLYSSQSAPEPLLFKQIPAIPRLLRNNPDRIISPIANIFCVVNGKGYLVNVSQIKKQLSCQVFIVTPLKSWMQTDRLKYNNPQYFSLW